MWQRQILSLVESHGIRCIAPDRRGFGQSEWTGPRASDDVTYDILASDTTALIQSIVDLGDFIFVCSSMGCGESVLVEKHLHAAGAGSKCKGFIWLAPSMPYPLQTESNPTAPSRELWDMILAGLRTDRESFVKASIGGVFGTHAGIEMSDESQQFFVDIIRRNDVVAIERCVQLFSNYDFMDDLVWLGKNKTDTPVVVIAGGNDNSKTSTYRILLTRRLTMLQTGRPKRVRQKSVHSYQVRGSKCGRMPLMACTIRMRSRSTI